MGLININLWMAQILRLKSRSMTSWPWSWWLSSSSSLRSMIPRKCQRPLLSELPGCRIVCWRWYCSRRADPIKHLLLQKYFLKLSKYFFVIVKNISAGADMARDDSDSIKRHLLQKILKLSKIFHCQGEKISANVDNVLTIEMIKYSQLLKYF